MAGRDNSPLALVALACLAERPMHPYEMARRLRKGSVARSVKVSVGSLYRVVGELHRAGMIEPKAVERHGRLPERTIYELTAAGRASATAQISSFIATPGPEYPQLAAGLSLLGALPADVALASLKERLRRLELQDAGEGRIAGRDRRVDPSGGALDETFRDLLRATELGFVASLVGALEAAGADGASPEVAGGVEG